MDKLKLIYNPNAGDGSFASKLDMCISILQENGYEIHIFRAAQKGDIDKHIAEMGKVYTAIVVAGGDGTIHIVVNAMMKHNIKIPLGIIPSGTANDFARFLDLDGSDVEGCLEAIVKRHIKYIDLGLVNGTYFINVFGGGLFANISQNVDKDFKNVLGKMAYYIDGIKQIPNFNPIPIRVTNSVQVLEDEVYLFLVLNTSGAGSFDKLAQKASIADGLLDFVAIKARPIREIAVLFVKILRGEHLDDVNVIFFQDKNIKIELTNAMDNDFETDVDGESGPLMPVEISILNEGFPIFCKSPD